jgi:hypothetical protein
VNEWEIEQRFHMQTDTRCGGYPECGPFSSREEAWSAWDHVPHSMTIVKVYQDERGWWAIYTATTSTTTLLPSETLP